MAESERKTAKGSISHFSIYFSFFSVCMHERKMRLNECDEKMSWGSEVKTFYQITMFYLLDLLTLSFIIAFLLDKLFPSL
jgi:hypothetical protein